MEILNTIHKRKSAVLTTIIMLLLLLLIFFFGLKYLDPPIESGIAVNFGTSEIGSGTVQPRTLIKTKVDPEVQNQDQVLEEAAPSKQKESAPAEEVLTQESEESIKIKQLEKEKRDADAAAKAARIKAELEAQKEADRIQKEQDAKKQKLDALIGGINNSEGEEVAGQGDDNIGGDKGKKNGDPNAIGFYGTGGNGGQGDYQLGNRRPLYKPKPAYKCEEEGLVVVTIEVDRAGKVIKATPGTKGSTNRASCLLSQAKIAALKTTWDPDPLAGSKQIGIIKYRFSLAE